MFQKLYRNLENISEGLDKSHLDAAATHVQVQEVNDSLALINKSINKQKSSSTRLYLQVANLCALVLIVILSAYYVFYASHKNPAGSNILPLPSTSDLEIRTKELHQNMVNSQIHLQKLDSLIATEARSLRELKSLNRTAVRTLQNIRKRLDAAGREPTGQQPATAPSLANQP